MENKTFSDKELVAIREELSLKHNTNTVNAIMQALIAYNEGKPCRPPKSGRKKAPLFRANDIFI